MSLIVDFSHVSGGRNVTGLERVTLDLFSPEALGDIPARYVRASSRLGMIAAQTLQLPLQALDANACIICPGFPPSIPLSLIARDRVIAYIHDLFLLTRNEELNVRARLYMRPAFRLAVTTLRRFLVNSEYTGAELRRFCRANAEIALLRPAVANPFGVAPQGRADRDDGDALRLLFIGTIEPRKNLLAAARIRAALAERLSRPVELHLIGRDGWGEQSQKLRAEPGVFMHGYLPKAEIQARINQADIYLATSHDEGLGLPLLEIQHGGLPVAASNIPAFRESLAGSGRLIDAADTSGAAEAIAAMIAEPGWRARWSALSSANVQRWNDLAAGDLASFSQRMRAELGALSPSAGNQDAVSHSQAG